MTKAEVVKQTGEFLKMGMDYDEALQCGDNACYDAEADACSKQFFEMCEDGTNRFEAFVKAFF